MPPQRRPLAPISGNQKDGKYLNIYQRGLVISEARAGSKYTDITRDLFLLPATVRYTIYQEHVRTKGASLPQKARNKSYTKADKRNLLRHV